MRRLSDEQRETFIRAYLSGASNADAAAAAGVSIGTGQRIRRAAGIPLHPRTQKREKHSRYLGPDVSYNTGHARVSAWRGKPKQCELCGLDDPSRMYHWANLTGNYGDIWDYKRMCVPCHRRFDFKPSPTCRRGHPRTEANTRMVAGYRRCLDCDAARAENAQLRRQVAQLTRAIEGAA